MLLEHYNDITMKDSCTLSLQGNQGTLVEASRCRPVCYARGLRRIHVYSGALITRSPVSSQIQDEPSSAGVLNCSNASPELGSKIEESRLTEWKKYQHVAASIPIKGKELEALLAEGHVVIPSKRVDTIKNWYERHKPGFEPQYKRRLVGW